ncbi:MAG: peptidoglycan DD-metalloendopeptidase family protein [Proteobacteria bacterium]|nr:peptidoglycan DD-metalloendopeptidase family protein [Pseudomonadota bacterium]
MPSPVNASPPEGMAPGRRPRRAAFATVLGLGAALLLAGAPVAVAEETGADAPGAAVGDKLKEVEKALEKSRREDQALARKTDTLTRQIADLRVDLIRAAKRAQDHEKAVTALQETIAVLNTSHRAKTRALALRRARLVEMIGALQRLARQPPEALIALPSAPQDTLRSAILLRAAVPQLEAQAKALRAELENLAKLKAEITAKQSALAKESGSLSGQRGRLKKLLGRKSALEQSTRKRRQTAHARARRLAARAKNLRELLAGIEAARKRRSRTEKVARLVLRAPLTMPALRLPKKPERPARTTPPANPATAGRLRLQRPQRPFRLARGQLVFPAQGPVVKRFGTKNAFGGKAKGITIKTLPAAQIVAPYDGQVAFSGHFRDYGQLLIIEHGGGYYTLLAGLRRIDAVASQWLLAGEPVGIMARPEKGSPELYIELRRDGRPINPLPWLAPPTNPPIDKVSG